MDKKTEDDFVENKETNSINSSEDKEFKSKDYVLDDIVSKDDISEDAVSKETVSKRDASKDYFEISCDNQDAEWEEKKKKSWKRVPYFEKEYSEETTEEVKYVPEDGEQNPVASVAHAIDGILYTVKCERNMKIDVGVAAAVLFSCLFLNFTKIELALISFCVFFVLFAEVFNTAIENVCDLLVGEKYSKSVRIAKDVSAGATLLAAMNAIVVAYLLFFHRFFDFSRSIYIKLRTQPGHLTFISILLVLIIVVVLKVVLYRGHGTPLRGGSASGHVAIAFCMATIMAFIANSTAVGILSYTLALLVAESRYEGKIHTVGEIVLGALVGIFVAAVIFYFFY